MLVHRFVGNTENNTVVIEGAFFSHYVLLHREEYFEIAVSFSLVYT